MKRIEMGHAGHFILGSSCQFRRATYVNGYIVSTVGELRTAYNIRQNGERGPFDTMGAGPELYESMVFHAVKRKKGDCCPYTQQSGDNLFERRWSTAEEAQREHERLVRVFSKRKNGLKKA